MLKKLMFLMLSVSAAYAWNNEYEMRVDRYGNVELAPRYSFDPALKYRGTIDSNGNFTLRNWNFDTLRGNIDSQGYGSMYDQYYNRYRLNPR